MTEQKAFAAIGRKGGGGGAYWVRERKEERTRTNEHSGKERREEKIREGKEREEKRRTMQYRNVIRKWREYK